MSKTAIIYWSGTGNTEAMAEAVLEGAKSVNPDTAYFTVSEISADDAARSEIRCAETRAASKIAEALFSASVSASEIIFSASSLAEFSILSTEFFESSLILLIILSYNFK